MEPSIAVKYVLRRRLLSDLSNPFAMMEVFNLPIDNEPSRTTPSRRFSSRDVYSVLFLHRLSSGVAFGRF
jgi:hypothetical protein